MADDRYVAFNVVARYTGQDTDEVLSIIEQALGCDGNEDECPMIACSSSGGTLEEMLRWSSGSGDQVTAIEAWFLNEYWVDYLGDCLNAGKVPVQGWKPDIGQTSQARADAERLAAWLAAKQDFTGTGYTEKDYQDLLASLAPDPLDELATTQEAPTPPGTYYDGCRAALRWYATHSDGQQWVGMGRRTLKEALAEVDEAERQEVTYGMG